MVSIRDVLTGRNCEFVEPCNIYEASFGDDVFVGPFTEIQSDVVIGSRTRVQSHAFICSMVEVGQDCFIGHGVMFTNDKFPGRGVRGDRSKFKTTKIGNRVAIGSNSTILPVSICDDVLIGAGSVVTRDINTPGTYAGNPARKID